MTKNELKKNLIYSFLLFLYGDISERIHYMEKHLEIINNNYLIESTTRNQVLEELNEVSNKVSFKYNNMTKNIKNIDLDISNINYNTTINLIKQKNIILLPKELLEINPFKDEYNALLEIGEDNGFYSFKEMFLCMYHHYNFINLVNPNQKEIYKYLETEYIMNSIDLVESTSENVGTINFINRKTRPERFYGIFASIVIQVDKNYAIITNGYFRSDTLNLSLRTSPILLPSVYKQKKQTEENILNQYPEIDKVFLSKYLKYSHTCLYIIEAELNFINNFLEDYQLFKEIEIMNFQTLLSMFIKSNLDEMYKIIYILMLGNNQCVHNGSMLFNSIREKKTTSHIISQIIYFNLPFNFQNKIKITNNNIKNEIDKIKTIRYEDIDIKKKITAYNIPSHVKEFIIEKYEESKINPDNSYKALMVVDALLKYPWKPVDSDTLFNKIKESQYKTKDFIKQVAINLDKTVYGHNDSKNLLLQLMGKWIQTPNSKGKVLGLVGPPGCGKTLLAQSISSALNIPFVMIPLGGMNDVSDLVGHGYTYASAQYGMIVREMIRAGKWRCVMLFDEVDKIGKKNETNDIVNQLIHITDPNSNSSFKDRFFSSSIDFDLSGVLMIFSYNDRDKIDPVLQDRFHEIEVKPYSINEKIDIVNKYLLKEVCDGIGFDNTKIKLSYETIRYIIENHTVEAGVRGLKRILETILLKLNIDRIYLRGPFRKIIARLIKNKSNEILKYNDIWTQELKNFYNDSDDFNPNKYLSTEEIDQIYNMQLKNPITIDKDLVFRYINKPTLEFTEVHANNLIGVVNALYATSIGTGGIIPIQILPNYFGGKNSGIRLKLTGSQGKDMIESITCAFNIAIHLLSDKHKSMFINKFPNGFHVHTPSIGSPKDGPSAGCAFATAFISIIIGKKINRLISMTGEIEATGRITKIGGLLYKLTGAKRAGIKLIFICKENEDDYNDIKTKYPDIFNDGLEVKIIEHIYQIISDPLVILNIDSNDFDKKIWKEYMITSNININ